MNTLVNCASKPWLQALQLTVLLALGAATCNVMANEPWRAGAHEDAHDAHWIIDARHGHNRYYPAIGVTTRILPKGYVTTRFHDVPYYFRGGIWYQRIGLTFSVVLPPIGAFVTVLPPFYTTLQFGGIPYYYADNVYYRWDAGQNGYIVSAPPADSGDANPPAAAADEFLVYPNNDQSKQQQATDRFQCYRWATDETGFDATQPLGGVNASQVDSKRQDYRRAVMACLEARGYSVK